MARLHLFEFEDQSWFPEFIRNYGTDFLQFLSNKTKMFRPVVPILTNLLKSTNSSELIDLGSGGGGGLIWLCEELQKTVPDLKVTLTDLYPNQKAFEYTKKQSDVFNYEASSIDARHVPDHLKGIRTMFLCFHHFDKTDATTILQNAVDSNQPIAIFEGQERSIPSFLAMFFSPITVLLTSLFIQPFKLGRLVFTYILPIVPLFVWWDGMVSSLRTYSVPEMRTLVNKLNNSETFQWDIGKVKSGPGIVLYLTGSPK